MLTDGRVVSGTSDNNLRIWNITNGISNRIINGHTKVDRVYTYKSTDTYIYFEFIIYASMNLKIYTNTITFTITNNTNTKDLNKIIICYLLFIFIVY